MTPQSHVHHLQRLDDRAIPARVGEIRAFMVVRNELLRIESNLRHHRALGVARFFIVDNGSDDGTRELLLVQPDVHLFETTASYAASGYGIAWTNFLLDAYGNGHWTLTLDADELLVYPHCERVALPALCHHLDAAGAQGMFTILLDMYSARPIARTSHRPGDSLIDTCGWFDRTGYRDFPAQTFPPVQVAGGVRVRAFWAGRNRAASPPTLSKVPLVRWHDGARFLHSTHVMRPVRLSAIKGALLHFKFLDDFHRRAVVEATRGEHYAQGSEYRYYLECLEADPALTLHGPVSERYRDTEQLVALGLIGSTPDYDRLAAAPG